MEKNYLDLTLKEFLDTITNKKIEYEIKITPSFLKDDDKSDTITCDKGTLIDYLEKITENLRVAENPDINTIKTLQRFDKIINDLEASDDYYFTELNDIEIYNYLDHITKGFDIERVKIILWDIDVYYNTDFLERINEESMNEYLKNGWEIPQKEIILFKPKQGKNAGKEIKHIITDFKEMRAKTHIADGLSIQTAINMLKKKLNYNDKLPHNPLQNKLTKRQAADLHNALCKAELIRPDIDSFLYWFGVTDNKDNLKRLEWTGKSKSLLAYFIDKITCKYNLKHGEKRLIKPFETMFNTSGITNSINEYKNKTGDLPVGYKEIDKLFS
jgi:hypothetical protein